MCPHTVLRLFVFAEHRAHGVGDLADRRVTRPPAATIGGTRLTAVRRGGSHRVERRRQAPALRLGPDGTQPLDLAALDVGDRCEGRPIDDPPASISAVDADDDRLRRNRPPAAPGRRTPGSRAGSSSAFDRRERAARTLDPHRGSATAPRSISLVSASMVYEPATGSTVFATPLSAAMICCVRSAIRADSSVGSASASSRPLQCSDCVPPSTAASACTRDADDVVVGLLRGERAAGRLRVEAELLRARVGGAEPVAHDPRPQPPRGAELRDLLEEVVVRVEEERQPLAELVDVEARRRRPPRRRRWRWRSVNATSCTAVDPASRM